METEVAEEVEEVEEVDELASFFSTNALRALPFFR